VGAARNWLAAAGSDMLVGEPIRTSWEKGAEVAKATDIFLKAARAKMTKAEFRTPIKFGGRVVRDAVIADVEIDVETRDGRQATGFGSMPMGNAWAWPSGELSADQTLEAMIALCERVTAAAGGHSEAGHPLELTGGLSETYVLAAAEVIQSLRFDEAMPKLAQLVATSPVEAAIHDAYGRVLGENSYNVLGQQFANRDLSAYLNDEFRGEYLDRYTLRTPKPQMPLYHLVGALDPLTAADVAEPVGDGLPETLAEWIVADGLTHMKIKLAGDDLAWDVDRVVAIEQVAAEAQAGRGCRDWQYSTDFNEKCESVEYVLDFLAQVQERSPAAFKRIQYIEQPTHRDLQAHPELRMHRAAEIKPVVIDESLVDFESLLLCRELGYSGVALKACKGQSEALLMGAAAQKYGMFLCVQDLTCVGASLLHSASLAARIPTVAAIEGNGRQYCPAGNHGWDQRYPTMFEIQDGTVGTSVLTEPGLGYWWS